MADDLDVTAQLKVDTRQTVAGMRAAAKATKSFSDMVKQAQREMRAEHRAASTIARNNARAQRAAARAQQEAARQAAASRKGAIASTNGLVGATMGLAAAYGVVSTASAVFSRLIDMTAQLTRQQIAYGAELERMQIGLASMVASVEGMSFAKAQHEADALYKRIVDISTQSPLGPMEMFRVFSGLNASMRNVGKSYDDILGTTQDAAAAIGAMGIDIDQASRDIALLAAGRAGMDVKTFTELNRRRAFEGKAIDTKTFNEMTAGDRVKALQGAFKRLGGDAAKAFANSFIGLSSTLDGLFKEFGRTAFSGLFASMKTAMAGINEFLIANRKDFDRILKLAGEVLGQLAGQAFKVALEGFKVFATAVKDFMGAVNALGPASNALIAAFPDVLKGGATAGTMAAGAGAGAIGGAAIGTAFGPLGTVIGALAGAFVGLVGTLTVVLPLVTFIQNSFWSLYETFFDLGQVLASSVWEAFRETMNALWPVIKILGVFIGTVLVGAVVTLTVSLSAFAKIIADVAREVSSFMESVGAVNLASADTSQAIRAFVLGMYDVANALLLVYAYARDLFKVTAAAATGNYFEAARIMTKLLREGPANVPRLEPGEMFQTDAPGMYARGGVGQTDEERKNRKQPGKAKVEIGKIEIRQNFQEATDPDRIVRIMYRDLEAQAERSIASPFAGALTR